MVTFYVASSGGSDNNSGSSEGSPKASGTGAATIVGATVDLSVDTPDLSTVVVGDTIRLNARTDGRGSEGQDDIFEITAVDDILKTVDVDPAPNSITSGVTWAIGGAFSTLVRAMGFAHAGEKCYIKGTFTGAIDLTGIGVVGVVPTTPVTIEGYTTTPGDGGVASFDGQGLVGTVFQTPQSTTNLFWIFKNLKAFGGTTYGFACGGGYPMQFINCEAYNCARGFQLGAILDCINCYAHDCTFAGFDCHDHNNFWSCISNDNARGIIADSGIKLFSCILYNNTTNGIYITGNFTSDPTVIVDSIIDGNGITDYGILGFAGSYEGGLKIINSMVINCDVGIRMDNADDGPWSVNAGLLMNGNGTDFENYTDHTAVSAVVTGVPTFVSEGVDWTPTEGSAAIDSGYDIRPNQFATVTGPQPNIGGHDEIAGGGDFPSENDVQDGVVYDDGNLTGNLVLPTEAQVLDTIGFGSSGTEFTGTLDPGTDVPAETDVRDGVQYDSTTKTGNLTSPAAADVSNGVQYGANGTEFTGVGFESTGDEEPEPLLEL